MNKDNRLKVAQVVINPKRGGGVSTEYQSLMTSSISEKVKLLPIILPVSHKGINLRDIRYYYKELKNSDYDIVHIRGAGTDSLNAIIAAKLLNKGKIYTVVHGLYSEIIYRNKIKKLLNKYLIENIIFYLSDYISFLYNNHKYEYKLRKKILNNVYNMYPYMDSYDDKAVTELRNKLGISINDFVVLYVGRITIEKGLRYLSSAILDRDIKSIDNIKFIFVGDGPYKEQMVTLLSEEIDKKRAIFIGNTDNVANYYYLSNIFINPSLHENHSISILEAIKTQTPVIVTNVGGNQETVINGEYGIIISPHSVNDIISAIIQLLDIKTFEKYKKNMCVLDNRFTQDEVIKVLYGNYIEIMRSKK